jgi:hypothetical protein
MATLEEIVVQLSAETSALRAEMSNAAKVVQGSTQKMEDAVENFAKNSAKNTSFFQTSMATMAGFLGSQAVLGAFNLLKDAVSGLAGELIDAGKEAIAEEQAFTRLATSLRLSGNYSKEAADDLVDYSNAMESVAGVSADVIASNLSLLSSLTKLSGAGLKSAETAAIDMAAALGKDVGTATEMVAKAINGNDMAFKKLGISMNLTSDSTKNLEIVTAALTERFGGSAVAKMNTFGGALFILKDAWGDMFKELSKAVTQNEVVIAVMKAAGDIFAKFSDTLKNSGTSIRDGIGQALIDVIGVVQGLVSGFSTFFKFAYAGFQTLATGVSTLYNGFMALGFALDGNTKKAGEYFSKIVSSAEATNAAWAATSESNFLDKTAEKIGELKAVAQTTFDEMKTKPLEAVKSQEALGNAVQKTSALSKEQSEALKSFASGLASTGMDLANEFNFANAMLAESNAQRQILLADDYAASIAAQQEFFATQQSFRDQQYASEQEQLATARANNLVTEEEFAAAKLALAQKYASDNAKQQTVMTQANANQEKTRQENFKSTMGTISSLASSGNKELAAIGKAAAIQQATVDGYAAVQKALASAPPPFGFALAAAVGAATAANVAKIAGVPGLKSGITEVPRSSSGGNGGDNFPAMLNPGERVVDSQTNQDLKAFLANQGGGSNVNVNVTVMPGTGLNNEQVGNLVEQLNNYFSSGGLRLVGAR